jgi:Na+/proline symporter
LAVATKGDLDVTSPPCASSYSPASSAGISFFGEAQTTPALLVRLLWLKGGHAQNYARWLGS